MAVQRQVRKEIIARDDQVKAQGARQLLTIRREREDGPGRELQVISWDP